MLSIGDYVALKPNLTLGRAYGIVKFDKHHVSYLHKVLKVYKTGPALYCSYNGYPCECGTFSESMLNKAKFRVGDVVRIVFALRDKQQPYMGLITTIKSIEYKNYEFIYHVVCDCGAFDWSEDDLESCSATTKVSVNDEAYQANKEIIDLEDLKFISENENQLQGEDSNIRSGERVKGSRVHGRISQASIRSRPLGNAKSIRGK